jgi:hypothetical protein
MLHPARLEKIFHVCFAQPGRYIASTESVTTAERVIAFLTAALYAEISRSSRDVR